MGLNTQPSGERVHIGFFGLRNAGKSSVVNRVTGQTLSIVSDVKGTTTDPVQKAMELLPIGPVVIIDTPGIDDEGTLGEERVRRALRVLDKTDIAVLVTDSTRGLQPAEQELLELFRKREIPFVIAHNKADLTSVPAAMPENEIYISAAADSNIRELKELIARAVKPTEPEKRLVADLLAPNDTVVLVVPIDSAAPKGRLILPQQQTIRDILEAGAISLVTRETELTRTLESLREPPRLVITDSQAFGIVDKLVPKNVRLTSFSILFARYKGNLRQAILGAAQLNSLQDGDTVLISEGCTHHRQCGDIGTEKLPNWIRRFTGKDVQFSFTAGNEFPEDVSKYALVVHCGGCMLNEREMQYRLRHSAERNVPMTNYGIAIAHMHGILDRALAPFPDLHQAWSSTANG
ncbi:[FeFe] hydrogenase H-cluster maturation GTPase HydF [Butyricicoccus sp. AM78-15b2TA]|uniref:[FeFe] hydrogenase H-cluster maturation GTPase HydF n=1 Tax=Butyricicoccus sp. AM78-15b2TA TaxID=3002516 RepID=UPI0022E4A475|nr:[FeFe] hydrogenase H-cluster maturation GTPase HydF [Butyricicoccus sp. AM78-15b2TA]